VACGRWYHKKWSSAERALREAVVRWWLGRLWPALKRRRHAYCRERFGVHVAAPPSVFWRRFKRHIAKYQALQQISFEACAERASEIVRTACGRAGASDAGERACDVASAVGSFHVDVLEGNIAKDRAVALVGRAVDVAVHTRQSHRYCTPPLAHTALHTEGSCGNIWVAVRCGSAPSSVGYKWMVAQLDREEVATVRLLVRVRRNLSDLDASVGMVYHLPRVILVALVLESPRRRALVVPNCTILHHLYAATPASVDGHVCTQVSKIRDALW
jgi:hypothetical protein